MKLIRKLSRRHLINSSDVFVIKSFTVVEKNKSKQSPVRLNKIKLYEIAQKTFLRKLMFYGSTCNNSLFKS